MTESSFAIYNGDCLSILKAIPDKCVDIIFTDPPYNVKKKYDGYNDNLPLEEYENWMREVISECNRVSKRGIIFYISGNMTERFFRLIPNSHLIVVHKRAAGVTSNNYMLQYHSILSTVTPLVKCKDLWDDIRLPGEGYFFREERFDNPGLTSELLVEKILNHFSKEGDLILDPFMGTGTTGVACSKLGRDFIGIEQSKKYCEIAKERLDNEQKHLE